MIGESSTWYAISALLSTSRSSAARASAVVVLEDAKELLCGVDDRVGLLGLEPFPLVDPAPGHGHGEHPRRLGRANVERRVPDVGRLRRIGVPPLGGAEPPGEE